MVNCSFCKKELEKGCGKMYVRKTGKVFWFCSNKCEKNLLKLKRNPAKLKWSSKIKKKA